MRVRRGGLALFDIDGEAYVAAITLANSATTTAPPTSPDNDKPTE